MKIILELPTHLSFPVIYQKDGEVYVMPENSKSGGISIYRYNSQNICLEKLHEVGKLPLTDATIVQFTSGEDYIFSTKLPNPNGNELQVYPFDGKAMFMVENPIANVSFQSNVARNAGDAFYIDEQMYRPAQDCNKCYGNGIEIQKVNKEGNTFVFETITSFHSDNPDYSLGYHTFNMKNGLIVVDGHRYRFPRMVKFLGLLHNIRNLKK